MKYKVSMWIEVEANSREEAFKKAKYGIWQYPWRDARKPPHPFMPYEIQEA
jgi:hypothetical protein